MHDIIYDTKGPTPHGTPENSEKYPDMSKSISAYYICLYMIYMICPKLNPSWYPEMLISI